MFTIDDVLSIARWVHLNLPVVFFGTQQIYAADVSARDSCGDIVLLWFIAPSLCGGSAPISVTSGRHC